MPVLKEVRKVDSKTIGATFYEQGVELSDSVSSRTFKMTGVPEITEEDLQDGLPRTSIEQILERKCRSEGLTYVRLTSCHLAESYATHTIVTGGYDVYRPAA